ncbi:alpha-ketoacid dehydrogenase subunit beta [Microbacterium sp. zg.B48]|uniref:alpha-ketoacid dehydrogenase subunit beta n=1 Tax=Microbacterium sp. zg.B48 TaxID=2969408 RepID=UPI00214B35AF|nr:transketolase C-terminal domain-containing protein [Microbacterium sp. zg.B48]MCR2764336.1 alpha-ketoacid dehydrogenase subunit beta [Microbacterium sp. zg.B48]
MSTVATQTRTISMAVAINEALDVALGTDEKVFLIGEDIADPAGGVFKVTKGLSSRHGTDRVRATPIAEQAIIGAAIGASMVGYRPVAEIMFFDFVTVAMDQIVNHAAKLRYMSGGHTTSPITVLTTVGSSRFGAQHAQTLEAWFMHTPGMTVAYPSTPADARGLMLSSVFSDDPVLFIAHSEMLFSSKGDAPEGDVRIPLGVADIKRAGDDVTIVTYGTQVAASLAAAAELAAEGIDVEVIDLRTLLPLDLPTVLESVGKTRRVIITHQATKFMGPGAEIATLITERIGKDLAAPVLRLGADYVPVPFSSSLSVVPTAKDIAAAARALVAE